MPESFHKFPSTPHLAWLGAKPVRGDKLLAPDEVREFLGAEIVVEEKIDGANLGLSFDSSRRLRFQNRGQWIEGKLTGQWERLRGWAAQHETALRQHLPPEHILFGEWCQARHSLGYDRLPDWFIGFDVFDGKARRFWSTRRRDALLIAAGIVRIPEVARGQFTLARLCDLLDGPSAFGAAKREGFYLRREDESWLLARAKLVQAEFTQSIGEHWSRRAFIPNHTAASLRPETASHRHQVGNDDGGGRVGSRISLL